MGTDTCVDAPLIYEILQGLIRKGETVRVDLQSRWVHGEGTLVSLDLSKRWAKRSLFKTLTGYDPKPTVRIHFNVLGGSIPNNIIEFELDELENHSHLSKAEFGWKLKVHQAHQQ